jgi:regulator of replication initiation timing
VGKTVEERLTELEEKVNQLWGHANLDTRENTDLRAEVKLLKEKLEKLDTTVRRNA